MKLPFTLTNDSLTIFVKGNPNTVLAGTAQYRTIKDAILREDWGSIPAMLTPHGALAASLGGDFTVSESGSVSYKGVVLPEALNTRLSALANEGLTTAPLLRFYERLHKNPSFNSRNQLFQFMQHLDIAIEEDGTFLAYKGLKGDMTDCHTGTIDNSPGNVIQMDRNLVSDNPKDACHAGLHVGSIKYARGFAQGEVVICRVDPEFVVSVPDDHSHQKMRVCRYEVVGIWSGQDMGVNADSGDLPVDYDEEEDIEDPEDDYDFSEEIEDSMVEPATINVALRKNLKPGTVFAYVGDGHSKWTYAVGNVTLPGAPEVECQERIPNMNGQVVVIWTPPEEAAPVVTVEKLKPLAFDTKNTRELMEESIEDLRKYASNRLKIHGASKIPGGKATLVAKIMKVRRRMK